jgi:hypothetical protein
VSSILSDEHEDLIFWQHFKPQKTECARFFKNWTGCLRNPSQTGSNMSGYREQIDPKEKYHDDRQTVLDLDSMDLSLTGRLLSLLKSTPGPKPRALANLVPYFSRDCESVGSDCR